MSAMGLPENVRLTAPRRAILKLLEQWGGSFAVAELHARARDLHPQLGLATTYRTVELLRKHGSVRRLAVDGHVYIRCSPTHHHHLVCTSCGGVEETELCAVPSNAELERRHGFRPSAHDLDIFGTCRMCAR